jgi:arsenate reductase
LHDVIELLGIAPEALIRKNEAIFKENFKGKSMTDDAWIKAMVEHPKLMERPIVVDGTRAVIGRPPENVKKLL